MKTAYTIHELVLGGDRVSPNSVVELEDKTFAELDDLGAIREATADEAAIANLGEKKAAVASAPATTRPTTRPTAADKKAAAAAAKKAEEDAAAAAAKKADADPDVTEQTGESGDLLGGN